MLHTETVDSNTLELIRQLQSDAVLDEFLLVGGTALALQIGHRKSIDLDLFTTKDYDTQELLEHLEKNYGFEEQYRYTNTLKGIIKGVFVDFLKHDYKTVSDSLQIMGTRLSSKQDIAAMKVNAITGNGTRVKDFIDIYFLLKEFTFKEVIDFYKVKYETRNDFHAVKSLTYFDDIVVEDWPVMILEKDLKLLDLQKEILRKRDDYLKKG